MKHSKEKRPLALILAIFMICAAFHYIEVLFIRTEETFLADNFINKAIGIVILTIALRICNYSWTSIGFSKDKVRYLAVGFTMGLFCFAVAYGVEYWVLSIQGAAPSLQWYMSGFSLTGEVVKQSGLQAFLLCILFNIVNVVMEEGVFRGIFINLGTEKYSFARANWFAALLFGIWHLSMPIKSLLDGQMSFAEAAVMGIGYVVLAMIMGVKWGLWRRNTNCLWFGMAEHFFNNTIVNLLHVASVGGQDEMQIVRVVVAQLLSLAITLVINRRYKLQYR